MASPASSQTALDAHRIVQLLLDAPALQAYYHFKERPERVPLPIVNASGVDVGTAGWTAAGKPAVQAQTRTDKSLVIESLSFAGDTAVVTFSFPVEGVIGEGRFRRQAGAWTTDAVRAAER